ncbi:MAG: hypothetical protein MGF17_18035 [Trichodesmium sp. MAG_R04]|nr:hypothetical protein [Trichodesmium sp. MAG_R04]
MYFFLPIRKKCLGAHKQQIHQWRSPNLKVLFPKDLIMIHPLSPIM